MKEGIVDHCLPVGCFVILLLEPYGLCNRANSYEHVTGKPLFFVT